MAPLRLLAVIEASSITGPAKNLLEFAQRAEAHNVSTTIATFTRETPENPFTEAVLEAAGSNLGITLETIPERGPFDPGSHPLTPSPGGARSPGRDSDSCREVSFPRPIGRAAPAGSVGRISPRIHVAFAQSQGIQPAGLQVASLRSANKVLTVNAPFRDELTALGVPPERIVIIHNAIPAGWGAQACLPEQAAALRARMGIAPDRKVILIVGRLSREKDHLTLLEAVNRLRSQLSTHITPHLVIVGEGPEKPRIEERVRRLGLDEYVTFTGQQSSAAPWYGIADVAVLSSLSEGSPNALLEAMATHVPVVATAVAGVPEIASA